MCRIPKYIDTKPDSHCDLPWEREKEPHGTRNRREK
jgi:hypothetical protein